MIGASVNAFAVLIGGGLGLLLKGKIPKHILDNILRAIGLCVVIIGISGALKGDFMLLVISLALGTLIGEFLNIDGGLNRFGKWLQRKLTRKSTENENSTSPFAEGFITAVLLFCVGAMAIVGSIEIGIQNNYNIIFTKSILDAVSAMVLASLMGFGVLFSAIVVFLYQGCIEFFAGYMQNIMTDALITQVSAAGSVMILAIGINMVLKINLKAANMLPGLLFAVGYYYLFLVT